MDAPPAVLSSYLEPRLEAENLDLEAFRELLTRLLNYGVLCRGESQVEQQLYDRYLRIAPLIEEYLELIGVRVLHDARFEYLRRYPPGSQIPGIDEADDVS